MTEVTLEPLTDDSEEQPEWLLKQLKALVATGHKFNAGLTSARGLHKEVEEAWRYVATAAFHEDRWQVHVSYFDEDDQPMEAAFGATVEETDVHEGMCEDCQELEFNCSCEGFGPEKEQDGGGL